MDAAETFVTNLSREVLNPFVRLLVGIAVVVFLEGLVRFLANSTNAEERQKGSKHMIWGFVGFVIMFSALGILRLISNSLPGV